MHAERGERAPNGELRGEVGAQRDFEQRDDAADQWRFVDVCAHFHKLTQASTSCVRPKREPQYLVDLLLTNGEVGRIFIVRRATKPSGEELPSVRCSWPDKSRISRRGRNPKRLTS